MPISSARLLIELLMSEQHRVGPAGVPGYLPSIPAAELPLVRAAAALAAGRAKRALRELRQGVVDPTDPDHTTVHEALYLAALALDLNWFPGDEGVAGGGPHTDRTGHTNASAPLLTWTAEAVLRGRQSHLEPTTAVVCVLAAEIIPGIRVARSRIAGLQDLQDRQDRPGRPDRVRPPDQPAGPPSGARGAAHPPDASITVGDVDRPGRVARADRTGGGGFGGGDDSPTDLASSMLAAADIFVAHLGELPVPQAATYARILRADLLFRLGRESDAGVELDAVTVRAEADHAALAHVAMVRGDWAGFPDGGAQTLGRLLPGLSPPRGRPRNRERAEELWQQSLAAYGRACSQGGRAAGLLRLAGAPTADDRPFLRRARIDEAARRALAAGDDSLTWLALVQSRIEHASGPASGASDPDALVATLAGWAQGDGSLSYARGLCRFLVGCGRITNGTTADSTTADSSMADSSMADSTTDGIPARIAGSNGGGAARAATGGGPRIEPLEPLGRADARQRLLTDASRLARLLDAPAELDLLRAAGFEPTGDSSLPRRTP